MKTNKEILEQIYLTAKDLKQLTGFGIDICRNIINEIQQEMKNKKYYIPDTKKKLVLTKLVKKKLGI